MPPTYTISFWIRPYNSGTLFSNNGIYDAGSQQMI
jgi:hypothetical protein